MRLDQRVRVPSVAAGQRQGHCPSIRRPRQDVRPNAPGRAAAVCARTHRPHTPSASFEATVSAWPARHSELGVHIDGLPAMVATSLAVGATKVGRRAPARRAAGLCGVTSSRFRSRCACTLQHAARTAAVPQEQPVEGRKADVLVAAHLAAEVATRLIKPGNKARRCRPRTRRFPNARAATRQCAAGPDAGQRRCAEERGLRGCGVVFYCRARR